MPKMHPNMLGLLGEGYVLPRPPSRNGGLLRRRGEMRRGDGKEGEWYSAPKSM